MTPESISSPYFTQEEIDAAIAAAPEYIYDPDRPLDPGNEAELNAYWSRGIVTVPGGHPHQDPLWRIHGKRHPVESGNLVGKPTESVDDLGGKWT